MGSKVGGDLGDDGGHHGGHVNRSWVAEGAAAQLANLSEHGFFSARDSSATELGMLVGGQGGGVRRDGGLCGVGRVEMGGFMYSNS
jgi:hypothetical protein